MHRFRTPELFLGCFLTVAVFGTGILFNRQQPAQTTQAVKQQEPASQGHKAESPDSELTGSMWLTKDAAGFFTFLLVAVGIGQAGLFFIQLRFMRRGMEDATIAANAARDGALAAIEANRINQENVIAANRRVVIDALTVSAPGNVVSINAERLLVGFTAVLKNIGKSPAQNIDVHAELRFITGADDFGAAQKEVCATALARRGPNTGIMIFPDKGYPGGWSADSKPNEFVPAIDARPTGSVIRPVIVGCITYDFGAASALIAVETEWRGQR